MLITSMFSPSPFVSLSGPFLGVSEDAIPLTNSFFLCNRFESQLLSVKERLEAAKSGSTRGLAGSGGPHANNAGGGGSFANNPFTRIAKPLRGGGGGESFGGLQGHAQQGQAEGGGSSSGSGGKRASWFFNGQRS